MVGKGKNKKPKDVSEPLPVVFRGNLELTIGTKVEAKDYLGNWYAAKIMKVRKESKEVLVHFDGWNSRFDVWLPSESEKLRSPKTSNRNKSKEKEWRVGDRVIAKWGPAGKLYPATISKVLNEISAEVTFYDGFRKTINKSSLKADKEKLYRQYEDIFRKDIISPPKAGSPAGTPKTLPHVNNVSGRLKRRLTEPAAMADYVTDLHKKRRTKSMASEEDLHGGRSNISLTPANFQTERPLTIPKVKLKISSENISVDNVEEITDESSRMSNKIKRSDVEIVKKKNKSYILFPLSSPKDMEDRIQPQHSKQSKRGAPVEIAPQNKDCFSSESVKQTCQETQLPAATSSSLKIKFPFSNKGRLMKGNKLENKKETKCISRIVDENKSEPFKDHQSVASDTSPGLQKVGLHKSEAILSNHSRGNLESSNTDEKLEKRKVKLSQKVREAQTSKNKISLSGKLRKRNATVKTFVGKQTVKKKSSEKYPNKPSCNFEDKYEMFKRKWKAEKERRRKMSVKALNDDARVEQKSADSLAPGREANEENRFSRRCVTAGALSKSIANIKTENQLLRYKLTTRPKQVAQARTDENKIILKQDSSEVYSQSENNQKVIKTEPFVENVKVSALSEPFTTNPADNNTTTTVLKAKTRGWPKGRPRKKKCHDADYVPDGLPDTSRTPNVCDTLSAASMVAEERPSQRKRPGSTFEVPSTKVGMTKPPMPGFMMRSSSSSRYLIQPPYKPFFSPIRQPYLSAAKLAAAKIQKRVHQQKWMSANLNISEQYPAVKPQDVLISAFDQVQNSLKKDDDKHCSDSDFDEESIIVVQPSADNVGSDVQKDSGNEIDLTNIKLREDQKSEDMELKPILKKRKSLDFITGRLQYKQRMASLKQQSLSEQRNFDVELPLYPQSRMAHVFSQQQNMIAHHHQHLTSAIDTPAMSANNAFVPGRIPRPPLFSTSAYLRNPNVPQNLRMMPVKQQLIPNSNMHSPNLYVSPMPPYRPRNVQPLSLPFFAQNVMQQFPNVQCLPSEVTDPRLHFPPLADRSVMVCNNGNTINYFPQNNFLHRMHPPPPQLTNPGTPVISSPPLTPIIPMSSQYSDSKHQVLNDSKILAASNKGTDSVAILNSEEENKGFKTRQKKEVGSQVDAQDGIKDEKVKVEADGEKRRKEKRKSQEQSNKKKLDVTKLDGKGKEQSMGSQPDVYTCKIPGCSKTFRKSHLLEYHQKYFHSIKPIPKRGRSSISSTDSNPASTLTSPVETVAKRLEGLADESIVVNDEEVESSDSEYEEDSPVDDRVKCVCQDDCELGFMIQCEQCFTWQHGECVGYSQQNDVPLYYLCHICSNPKGLRKSQAYKNDFIWFRHGRLHPVHDAAAAVKSDTNARVQHVDVENEEVLSNLMLTVHGMVADLSRYKDCMQQIRNNFILFKDVNHPKLQQWEPEEGERNDLLKTLNQHQVTEPSKCNALADGVRSEKPIDTCNEKENLPTNDNDECTSNHFINEGLAGIFKETILENAEKETLLARYKLLVEVERVEDELNERLEEMVRRVTELEEEYDHIDRSEAVIADLKAQFKLPNLSEFLNKVKWTSILKSSQDSNVQSVS